MTDEFELFGEAHQRDEEARQQMLAQESEFCKCSEPKHFHLKPNSEDWHCYKCFKRIIK